MGAMRQNLDTITATLVYQSINHSVACNNSTYVAPN